MSWLKGGRLSQLMLSWAAYWAVLLAVGLGKGAAAAWSASQVADNRGSVSAGFSNGEFYATVVENGATTWNGTIGITAAALLIAVPPLVMWAMWLRGRRAMPAELHSQIPAQELAQLPAESIATVRPPRAAGTPVPVHNPSQRKDGQGE